MTVLKQLPPKFDAWLRGLAKQLTIVLNKRISDPAIIPQKEEFDTDSFGYAHSVARLKGKKGNFEVWVDLFPNLGRPILSVCFDSPDRKRVIELASAHQGLEISKSTYAKTDLHKDGDQFVLARPLPAALFGKPIVESYFEHFYSVYFPDVVNPAKKASPDLVRKVAAILETMMRSAAANLNETEAQDYPAIENRRKVLLLLLRERSRRLSKQAKDRDGYVCQVCGFDFVTFYGEHGRGYAEAHHRVPLHTLRKSVRSKLSDLITVCANCHRVLHRMKSKPSDIAVLKRAIRKIR